MSDEAMNKFIDVWVDPGLQLVDPEHRTHVKEYKKFMEERFFKWGKQNEIDGYFLNPGMEPGTVRYAYNQLKYKNGDVLVVTYPKSGTTWVTRIVQNILYRHDLKLLELAIGVSQFYSYLEFGPVSKYEVMENIKLPRRFFGTHLPEALVNSKKVMQSGGKIIYVMRNPKDRAVSWYNFVQSLPYRKHKSLEDVFPKNESDFLDVCFSGKQRSFVKDGEGYLESLREWYKHKDDENFKVVVFEELRKNPITVIQNIATFLGEKLTDEELMDIVEMTSFAAMKKQAESSGTQQEGGMQIFRKGKAGAWKDHLTVAQSELVDRKVKEILGHTDIKFTYD